MNVDIEQIIAWYGEAMIERRLLAEALEDAQAEIVRLQTELGNALTRIGTVPCDTGQEAKEILNGQRNA